ncbi:hypothetical protein ACRE1U_04625 [Helicobacter himalayensis]|uniref:hypothetical protein n=1 Tax=Helicobacter himalayensis TaxID=1591088 RepID=UPI003D6DAD9A
MEIPANPPPSPRSAKRDSENLDTFTELEKELEARHKQYEYYRNKLLSKEELEKRARKHLACHSEGFMPEESKRGYFASARAIRKDFTLTSKYDNKSEYDKNNPLALSTQGGDLEAPHSRPLRGAEKERKGSSSASALLELEADKRGTPFMQKKGSFSFGKGSGEGLDFLCKE